ncbi:MAG: hypothetical protein JO071_07055, partial [Deltaproteobacteria bacterium]|nr:hypothetical protein [Deltaproteobacteria bacterium]
MHRTGKVSVTLLLGLALLCLSATGGGVRADGRSLQDHIGGRTVTAASSTDVAAAQRARILASYGKLPLSFEANRGQSDRQVKFLSRGNGYALFLTPTEAVLSLRHPHPNPLPGRGGAPQPSLLKASLLSDSRAPSGERRPEPGPAEEYALLRLRLEGANRHLRLRGINQ